MSRWNTAIRLLLVLLLALASSSCGRGYSLAGRIVWLESTETFAAGIHEVTGRVMPSIGLSIAGASVTLFHELTGAEAPIRESVWRGSVATKDDGTFELFSYATPGRVNRVGLEVSAPGFETEYVVYEDYIEPDLQTFFVVLSRQ